MSRAPALFTEADIRRAFIGAAKAGVQVRVVIHNTGVMIIEPVDEANPESHPMPKEGSGAGWFNEDGTIALRS